MPGITRETRKFNPEHDIGDEECVTCGNPKWQKACPVCSKEMSTLEYKKSAADQSKAENTRPEPDRMKEKPEIPKDPKTGKPKYGPGSDQWEESKRKLGIK